MPLVGSERLVHSFPTCESRQQYRKFICGFPHRNNSSPKPKTSAQTERQFRPPYCPADRSIIVYHREYSSPGQLTLHRSMMSVAARVALKPLLVSKDRLRLRKGNHYEGLGEIDSRTTGKGAGRCVYLRNERPFQKQLLMRAHSPRTGVAAIKILWVRALW